MLNIQDIGVKLMSFILALPVFSINIGKEFPICQEMVNFTSPKLLGELSFFNLKKLWKKF